MELMSKRIAILGASGAVGSTLATQILRVELLQPTDTLLLVGHGMQISERKLLGMRIDLLDAFDDEQVRIEVLPDIGQLESADIVVVASGATISSECPTRRDLGIANRPIFEHIAEYCAFRLPKALYIVVSNPVEIGVQILSSVVSSKRVIGMGAQQDSLRFARAIASDLKISRHDVRASVLGEHGSAMLPLWRSVELLDDKAGCAARLDLLAERAAQEHLEDRVATLHEQVLHLIREERIDQAYELAKAALPDARIFVEPFITVHCLHSTPNATANATLQCIAAALSDDRRHIHAQVSLGSGTLGEERVCGIPIYIDQNEWRAKSLDWLNAEERRELHQCADSIRQFATSIMA
jgi:malate dehydrogenase